RNPSEKEGARMTVPDVVFLFDVDNTLLDNDRVAADLRCHLEREVGPERQQRYWVIFEELRALLVRQLDICSYARACLPVGMRDTRRVIRLPSFRITLLLRKEDGHDAHIPDSG